MGSEMCIRDRFWVLKLLHDNFGPGDKVVEIASAASNHPYIYSVAFATRDGKRRVLLVNKRDRAFEVVIPGATGAKEDYVDQTTAFQPPVSKKLETDTIKLGGFAVKVVTLP